MGVFILGGVYFGYFMNDWGRDSIHLFSDERQNKKYGDHKNFICSSF